MMYLPLWLEDLPFELKQDPLPNYTKGPSNSFEWRKIIFGMITSMGIRHAKAYTFAGASSNSKFRSHFTHPHCEALKTVPEPRQQSMGHDGSVFVYNLDYLREQFIELLIESISTDLEFLDDVHATRTKQWFNESLAGFDVLGFWKSKESMFLVLSHMAIDVLSVQATSVAFKSAFSTSGRVLSIRRTKLTPSSLEMCMCLKYHLDAQERKQHTSTLENALYFEDEVLDAEVQENEATPLSD
ncbi:zinc finger BED domain-containing protein RICESLEEPER 2 [Tanacetum coccineum]